MDERIKVFVLGGTGFIGSALMDIFRKNPDRYQVMMLINKQFPHKDLEIFNTYTGDLRSFDLKIIDEFRPDVIIHMARMSGATRLGRKVAAIRGALANERLIRHLKKSEKKPHIIYLSGTLVYGNCGEELVNENHHLKPIAFAREYIIAEKPWMVAMHERSLSVCIMRPPWIIGRGSWFDRYYLDSIRKHEKIPLFGEGNNWMSLIDVEDCAGIIEHSLTNYRQGGCYNIYTPECIIRQKEFTGKISSLTGLQVIQLGREQIIKLYGNTMWEAFTFSLISSTNHL
jgi:nucleoside-diphosphate-sugar epimerase